MVETATEESFLKLLTDDLENRYNALKTTLEHELELANVRHPSLTDHGWGHSERIIENLGRILSVEKLKELSKDNGPLNHKALYILLVSVYLHDIGYAYKRTEGMSSSDIHDVHDELSAEIIEEDGMLSFLGTSEIRNVIAEVSSGHRRKKDLSSASYDTSQIIDGDEVKKGFLSALLRMADALDITQKRAPEKYKEYVTEMVEYDSRLHWDVCSIISGWTVEESRIKISARPENYEQRALLEWKIDDLWNELASCRDVLSRVGDIELHGIKCDLAGEESKLFDERKIERPELITYSEPPLEATYTKIEIDEEGNTTLEFNEKFFWEEYFKEMEKIVTEENSLKEFGNFQTNSFYSRAEFNNITLVDVNDEECKVKYKISAKICPYDENKKWKYWALPLLGSLLLEARPSIKLDEKGKRVHLKPRRFGPNIGSLDIEIPDLAEELEIKDVKSPPFPPHTVLLYKTKRKANEPSCSS